MTTMHTVVHPGAGIVGVRVNSKFYPFDRIAALYPVGQARWGGRTVSGLAFHIEGGKAAGGSPRDWFLDIEGGNGAIVCTSAVDALRTINNA